MSHSSSARSDRPNVEQKRKLAKELLRGVKQLDARSAARFTWNHPEFQGQTPQDVFRRGVRLSQAQHVIARESGFASWPKLVEYVARLTSDPNGPEAAFEDAVHAIIRGDENQLRRLLQQHPQIATMRSSRHHSCVLPHYLAANGVEDEHQVVPANAPEIARILFAAGADTVVDAETNAYGGGAGSTPLVALVTSTHPHEAGVQAELVRLFYEAGANVDGLEDDGLPLAMALGFRYPRAARALVDCGARVDNLPAAAAVGSLELVRNYLDTTRNLQSESCTFPNPGYMTFDRSVAPHPVVVLEQAFVFACMCGRIDVAKLLRPFVDVGGGPRAGITAVHEACYQGHAEIVHWLISERADPTCRDEFWNSTAIGWASAGGHGALVDWLFSLEHVDFLDALQHQKYSLVQEMLDHTRDLANAPDGTGAALRRLAQHGDVRMMKMLLDYGADPLLCDEQGLSALDYAQHSHQNEAALILKAAMEQGEANS